MKNLLILPLFLLLAFSTTAQETLNKGVIKMELTEASSDNEQMAAAFEMMKGSETNYFFNEEVALVKQSFMGGMLTMSTHSNSKTDATTLLFDMMGQKMMVETTKEELNAANNTPEAKKALENMKISYDKANTKEILGYKCYKADVAIGNGMQVSLYVTDEIKADNSLIKGLETVKLDGFPLEVTMDMPEFKMVYTTTAILKEIESAQLVLNTTGYKKMTFDEFQKTMGSMGGMGF